MTYFKQCPLCDGYTGGCTGRCTSLPPMTPPVIEAQPKGCICPPTSEKTCDRWDCGRKNFTPTTTTGTIIAGQPR